MKKQVLTALILALLAGCSETPFSIEKEDVVIRTNDQTVEIFNRADEPLYYYAVVRPVSPLHDWWPCTDPEQCTAIEPGEGTVVPYGAIAEYDGKAREAVITWWFLDAKEAGHQVAGMQSQIIAL